MGYQEYLQIVKELNYKFRYYKSIESLFEYDQWSSLPEEGTEYRQQTAAFIGEEKMHCTGAATPAERQSICPASLRMRSEMRSSAGW